MKKVISSFVIVCTTIVLVGCNFLSLDIGNSKCQDVGILINKSANNELVNEGIKNCETNLGIKFNILEIENNNLDKKIYKQAKSLVRNNSLTIFTDSGLQDVSNEVAMLYKEKDIVTFEQKVEKKNVLEIGFKYNDISYIMGVIAASESKSDNIGIIAFDNTYKIQEYIGGFIAGVNSKNSKMGKRLSEDNIKIISKDASLDSAIQELVDNKCDIVFEVTNEREDEVYGVLSNNNIKIISNNMLTSEFYKKYSDSILINLIKRENIIIEDIVSSYQRGTFKSGSTSKINYGLNNNMIDLSKDSYGKLGENIKKEIESIKEKIITGEINVPETVIEALEFV